MLRIFLIALLCLGSVAVAQTYTVKPGDTLRLEVIEDPNMARSLLVLPDGTVSIPLVGNVQAAGKSVPEIEAMVLQAIGPNYVKPPHLTVSVASLAKAQPAQRVSLRRAQARSAVAPKGITVFAMGELAKPGKLAVTPGTTVLQLVAEVGGFTRFAASKRLILRRADKNGVMRAYRVNAKKMMTGGAKPIVLQSGDVVVVPERKLFE